MSLNLDEVILDKDLRDIGTSLYEICSIARVPVEEHEFYTNTSYEEYKTIVESAVIALDTAMEGITGPFLSSMSVKRPVFTYERLWRVV